MIQIGTSWFASETTFNPTATNTWGTHSIADISTANWLTLSFDSANNNRVTLGTSAQTLSAHGASGSLTSVGLYLSNTATTGNNSGSQYRIDNIVVTAVDGAAPDDAYTVTYAANGGTGDVPEDLNIYAPGSTITVMGQGGVTREGHTFLGWRDEVAGETYAPLATFAMPERDVTLAAQWTQSATDAYGDWAAANNITGNLIDLTNGVPNLIRYALGGDADTPIGALHPQLQSHVVGSDLRLSLTFHRIADPLVIYKVWYSEDLVNWGSSPVLQDTGAHEGIPGEFEVSRETTGNRGFLRLEVTRD